MVKRLYVDKRFGPNGTYKIFASNNDRRKRVTGRSAAAAAKKAVDPRKTGTQFVRVRQTSGLTAAPGASRSDLDILQRRLAKIRSTDHLFKVMRVPYGEKEAKKHQFTTKDGKKFDFTHKKVAVPADEQRYAVRADLEDKNRAKSNYRTDDHESDIAKSLAGRVKESSARLRAEQAAAAAAAPKRRKKKAKKAVVYGPMPDPNATEDEAPKRRKKKA